MNPFCSALAAQKLNWVVTGSAGFIGSHLLEILLRGQRVVSVDNFSTGKLDNLHEVEASVGEEAWKRHGFIRGDIADRDTCRLACRAADVVLHQAALGWVPRSIADPVRTHEANVERLCEHARGRARGQGTLRLCLFQRDLRRPSRPAQRPDTPLVTPCLPTRSSNA